MSIYPIHTLQPGDRIDVAYMQSSANCDSWRTDTVTVARVEGDYVHATDGCRYHEMAVSRKIAPDPAIPA